MPGPSSERTASRTWIAAFVAYLAATAVHVGWVMHHEPFSFDAWNVAVDTHGKPFTLGRFWAYWRLEYFHSNPRIGQPLTYLCYKLAYFAVIATPLAFLGIALAVFVLGTGRWPSLRRRKDLALWTIALGSLWFALPAIGKTMFCRAYGANYVYGAAIQLWFLVPLRLARRPARPVALAAYAAFGVIAGLCNEHTGPILCAFLVGYAWWRQRQTGDRPWLAWAGAAGAIVGFAGLFFAPGQGQRYDNLAERATMLGRVLHRGIGGNLDLLRDLLEAAGPLLLLAAVLAIVALRLDADADAERRAAVRRAFGFVGGAMLVALIIAVTLFVSPKQGPRFHIAGMALLLAALLGVADLVLDTPRRLAPLVAVAVFASGYAAFRTVPLYHRVSRESDARIAALEHAPRGSVFTADAFDQIDPSWWFLGDDFRDVRKREMVRTYFGLSAVVLRGFDKAAPLGVSGARFVAHATLSPPGCLDTYGGFTLAGPHGFDLEGVYQDFTNAITTLRARLPAGVQLDALELSVGFDGAPPKLPEPDLVVARWRPDGLEAYHGAIVRKTSSTTRDVKLPPAIAHGDFDIYVTRVGAEVRHLGKAGAPLHYVPWAAGVYWVLACHPGECFVIAATRSGA